MLLNISLNNDIKRSHNFYCAAMRHLHNNDPDNHNQRKFSIRTPSLITHGINILVEYTGLPNQGVLSSTCIIHDCDQALDAMHVVFSHDGAIVLGLDNMNDNRYMATGT